MTPTTVFPFRVYGRLFPDSIATLVDSSDDICEAFEVMRLWAETASQVWVSWKGHTMADIQNGQEMLRW